MAELRELYQEVILDHNKAPRNFRKLDDADRHAEGFNPLCGDHYHVYLNLDTDGVITDVTFEGAGCAISKASASMMTSLVKGKSIQQVEAIFENYRNMITGEGEFQKDVLGKLMVFSEVGNYPTRIKCAVLCWHTLHAAITGSQDSISTE